MKRSKKYEEAAKKVDRNKIYSPIEAATLIIAGTARSMGIIVDGM